MSVIYSKESETTVTMGRVFSVCREKCDKEG